MNRASTSPVITCPAVVAVFSAPEVRVSWLSVSHFLAESSAESIWSWESPNGPVTSQSRTLSMPVPARSERSEAPAANCWTTIVMIPTTISRPPRNTVTVARLRFQCLAMRNRRTGLRSAVSSRAMAIGITTSDSWPTSQISTAKAPATTSSRHDQSAAIRIPGVTESRRPGSAAASGCAGICWSGRSVTVLGPIVGVCFVGTRRCPSRYGSPPRRSAIHPADRSGQPASEPPTIRPARTTATGVRSTSRSNVGSVG